MNFDRRKFLGITASGAVLAASGSFLTSFSPEKEAGKAELKISCQENVAPGNSLAEKLDFLENLGVAGLEVGGSNLENRVEEIGKALSNRKIKISAICAGFEGWLIASDPEVRKECIRSMKTILEAAGALGSTGLIFVPAFHSQVSLPHKESRELLVEELKELAAFAAEKGTRMLLEPLNREECYFCRQVADAAAIMRDVANPAAAVMGDFWHMTWEETSDRGAFLSAGKSLHHVHIASRKSRNMPGEDGDADVYTDGFKGLKEIGYHDYISFECGSVGDSKITLPAAVNLIRRQWKQA